MTVVIHTNLHYSLTTPSMTRMTSLTQMLFVDFVYNCVFALSLDCNRQDDISLIDCESTWFGV